MTWPGAGILRDPGPRPFFGSARPLADGARVAGAAGAPRRRPGLTCPATLLPAAGPRGARASSTIRAPEGAGRGEGLAGFIIVCARDRSATPFTAADLRRCALALGPDTIEPNAPDVYAEDGLVRAS